MIVIGIRGNKIRFAMDICLYLRTASLKKLSVCICRKNLWTGQRMFIKNLHYACWGYVIWPRLRLILVLGHDNYLAKFGNQAINATS